MKATFQRVICALLVSLVFTPQHSFAFLNNFDTAKILPEGQWNGKLGITSSDDFFLFFAGARYAINKGLEITGRGGILDVDLDDGDTGALIGIGGRYKAAFFADPVYPDFALQGTYDLGFADGKALHSLAGALLLSKEVTSPESKSAITPYGGPELEILGGSLNDDTDVKFHLALGVEFLLDRQFGIVFEGKIGGQSSLGIGVTYKF